MRDQNAMVLSTESLEHLRLIKEAKKQKITTAANFLKIKMPYWFQLCFTGLLPQELVQLDIVPEEWQKNIYYISAASISDIMTIFLTEFIKRSKVIASSLFEQFIGVSVSSEFMVLAFRSHLGTCKKEDQKLLRKYWTTLIETYKKRFIAESPAVIKQNESNALIEDQFPIHGKAWARFYYAYVRNSGYELDDHITFTVTTSINTFLEKYHTIAIMDFRGDWESVSRNHQLLLVIIRSALSLISNNELGLSQMMQTFETVYMCVKYPGVVSQENEHCLLKTKKFYIQGHLKGEDFQTDNSVDSSWSFLPVLTQAIYDERFVVTKPLYSDSEVLAIVQMCGFTYSKLESKKEEFGL